MAIELITGKGGEPHVDSADIGRYNTFLMGGGNYFLSECTCTVLSPNEVNVSSCDLICSGRYIRITGTGENVSIDNGASSYKRSDIVALHYSKDRNGVENTEIVVVKGTMVDASTTNPPDPEMPSTGSIMDEDNEAYVPLFRVVIDGLTPTTPVPLVDSWTLDVNKLIGDGVLSKENGGTGRTDGKAENVVGVVGVANGGTGVTTNAAIGLKAYPVGALYISYSSTSPASLFGGTWTQITGRFLRAANDVSTGGADSRTLTVAQIPPHYHNQNIASPDTSGTNMNRDYASWGASRVVQQGCATMNAGGGESFDNRPAFQDVYVWRRTA